MKRKNEILELEILGGIFVALVLAAFFAGRSDYGPLAFGLTIAAQAFLLYLLIKFGLFVANRFGLIALFLAIGLLTLTFGIVDGKLIGIVAGGFITVIALLFRQQAKKS